MEKQLASSQVPKEEQINLIKDLERKETEYMRLKRHKICVDDFDLLTIIGRGAFGEVSIKPFSFLCVFGLIAVAFQVVYLSGIGSEYHMLINACHATKICSVANRSGCVERSHQAIYMQ